LCPPNQRKKKTSLSGKNYSPVSFHLSPLTASLTIFSVPALQKKRGRPTKRSPELVAQIAEAISFGFSNQETAELVGIRPTTLSIWHQIPSFSIAVKRAVLKRQIIRLKRIQDGTLGWQGTAWILERLNAVRYARPEVQIAINSSGNPDGSGTSIVIQLAPERVREIDSESVEIRDSVAKMLADYRPQSPNGNGGQHV
jgi:hypothetical protein